MFDKSLSIAMIANLDNRNGNIVDLMWVFIRRIAENVLSQDAFWNYKR
jgi:hypothetical protein